MTKIISISIDDDGELTFGYSDSDKHKELWRKNYGRISEKLLELSQLIARKRYPPLLNELGFTHVLPSNDLITHTADTKCSCAPKYRADNRTYIHHAMDGREAYPAEPVKWLLIEVS